MPYYNICPHCGSHLDPGERCDCQNRGQEPERREAAETKKEEKSAHAALMLHLASRNLSPAIPQREKFGGHLMYASLTAGLVPAVR